MDNMENLVTEQVTENVEQTTEQTPKMFTQEEVNEIVGKSKARARAKVEKEYERKYGSLMNTLQAGTGKTSVEEIDDTFTQFYEQKGIKINKTPAYSQQDVEVLAREDFSGIIQADEADEEFNRLEAKGAKMTPREKETFRLLADYLGNEQRKRELTKIGVTEDVYNSQEFKDFAGKFNPNTPIKDIYDIYAKTQPKKEIKTMGSMKNTAPDSGVKEFYTPEEARKFSKADFDNNPKLWANIQASMLKWRK